MKDSELISFLHGQGIKIPEKNLNPRGFFLQLLKDQDLKDEAYYPWAVEKYELPFLKNDFFKQFAPQLSTWEQEKDNGEWDEGFLPLYHWEGKLVIGCVDLPEEYILNSQHILVLCSILELEKIWRFYHSPQEFSFIDQFGIQPIEHPPSQPSQAPLLENASEKSVENHSTADHSQPEDLLVLSDEEPLDMSAEETAESASKEANESEMLSFDMNVAPPVLSLQSLTPESVSPPTEEIKILPAEENVAEVPKESSAILNELQQTAGTPSPLLKVISSEKLPPPPPEAILSPLIQMPANTPAAEASALTEMRRPPPPPPPSALKKLDSVKPLSPAPGATVLPLPNEKIVLSGLLKDLNVQELQMMVEQIFKDFKSENQTMFFGLVHHDKRQIELIWREKTQFESLPTSQITVDQPSILNIVLRTQKPFYGKPVNAESNRKLYKIVNDEALAPVIMVIPFSLEDKVLAIIGFIAEESSYNLDRLSNYESRFHKEFRIKLGLTTTNLEQAS